MIVTDKPMKEFRRRRVYPWGRPGDSFMGRRVNVVKGRKPADRRNVLDSLDQAPKFATESTTIAMVKSMKAWRVLVNNAERPRVNVQRA